MNEQSIPNVFRPVYRELNEEEKNLIDSIKTKAYELYCFLEVVPASREVSLAKTKLEESVMWAVKRITQ